MIVDVSGISDFLIRYNIFSKKKDREVVEGSEY